MPLNKITSTQAENSLKKLQTDASSLSPSALIQLFEIDLNSVLTEKGLNPGDFKEARNLDFDQNTVDDAGIFRLHNVIKLTTTSIFFDSNKDGILREFIACPIEAKGFEVNSRGTNPVPVLSLTTSEEGITSLAVLKDIIRQVGGDLAGARVTRIRTLAKYLHGSNFPGIYPGDNNPNYDENIEFPRDIYYIDRKSNENKNSIEFELASLIDLEGINLPLRRIIANRCVWLYRGEGCRYGKDGVSSGIPVADLKDEKISGIDGLLPNVALKNRGKWVAGTPYSIGDYVYIERTLGPEIVPFYFVCKFNGTTSVPTNSAEWVADVCSKSIFGCQLRFKNSGMPGLPFGGFPAVSKLSAN